jgi:hypothetical protein
VFDTSVDRIAATDSTDTLFLEANARRTDNLRTDVARFDDIAARLDVSRHYSNVDVTVREDLPRVVEPLTDRDIGFIDRRS